MKRILATNTFIILISLLLALGINFFWVSKSQNIKRNYGSTNFTGWLLTENEKTFFLRSQFTPDRNNLHYVTIPLKIENKINPKGNIYFAIKYRDEKNLVTKVAVDNFSQELGLEIDTSPIKESKYKTYDLELDISKESSQKVPIFNRKPFITAQYEKPMGEKNINPVEYLRNLRSTLAIDFVLMLRPVIAITIIISLVLILLTKLITKIPFTMFDFVFVSLGIPLIVVYGQIIGLFFFFLFSQKVVLHRKAKINPTATMPFIFFGSAIFFFTFASQVAGNKLAFFAFLILSANTIISMFKRQRYLK